MRDEERIKDIFDLGIIGGGAAGLFAASFAKKRGLSFLVLEKTDFPGKKLLLTGGGRCNILNLKSAVELKTCYHDKGNFLYPALSHFPPSEAYSFIENELGLKLAEEENNRIFPASGKARDVVDSLISYIGRENIKTLFEADKVIRNSEGIWEVRSRSGDVIRSKNLILAAGGSSYPQTGSAGDSYRIAESLGHAVIPARAALAAIKISGRDKIKVPAGLTVKGCRARIVQGDKTIRETEGDVLFTHEGLSGPAIMELSRDVKKDSVIKIDLAPDLTDKILTDRIGGAPQKKLSNVLGMFVAGAVAENAVMTSGADPDITCAKTTKEIRRSALKAVKEMTVQVRSDPDIKTAYVTAGGVDTGEVNRKTLESKIAKGLYLAGEALDRDGISGGYNLTICIAEAKLILDSLLF